MKPQHLVVIESGHRILNCKVFHFLFERMQLALELGITHFLLEVFECVAARGFVYLDGQLEALVNEVGHLHEIGLFEIARSERRRTNANATWRQCALITRTCVLVDCDRDLFEHLFHFASIQTDASHVHREEVSVRSAFQLE